MNGTVKRFNKESHPEEVEKLYETFAERFSGMLVRNEKWWLQAVYDDLTLAIYTMKIKLQLAICYIK